MTTVTLVNGKSFETDSERTILDSALNSNIFLEYSCRTGRCGICKAKVVKGETNIVVVEESLTDEDRQAGNILTCCRSAVSDMVLESEDLGVLVDYPAKTVPCRIDSIQKLTDKIIEVVLRFPPGQSPKYLPGQYVDAIGKDGVRRSYSIANAPRDDGRIVLFIKYVDGGVMSQYWFNEAASNDLLRLEGPLGTFFLRDSSVKSVVFLATGTGIAPVKALLEEIDSKPELANGRTCTVLWGNRVAEEIFWKPDFNNFDIDYKPVLSRAEGDWVGAKGYVQDVLHKTKPNVHDLMVYACGSDEMIKSAKKLLFDAGLPESHFYSDAFVSSN